MIYVLDTNVLVDYPDIIPDAEGNTRIFDNPLVSLAGSHIVVPSAVVRELSSFKDEAATDRGRAARLVLDRLRMWRVKTVFGMETNYMLEAPIKLPDGRLLSVLPVSADFKGGLPFRPDEGDMDGQIILTALAAMHLVESEQDNDEFDWGDSSLRLNFISEKVVLLTNDNGHAIRAAERGIVTSRYAYAMPAPYTGRREVKVPAELFQEFWTEGRLDLEFWEDYLPDETPLAANEFVVMVPEDMTEKSLPFDYVTRSDPYFRHIGRFDAQREMIVGLKHLSSAPFTPMSDGQAMYAEALMDPEIAAVICTGPAGSGKTYLPTVYGLEYCRQGKYKTVVVVPCPDYGNLGALPGDLDEKMSLDVGPIRNALENYFYENDPYFKRELKRLGEKGTNIAYSEDEGNSGGPSLDEKVQAHVNYIWKRFFRNVPVKKAQGLDFRQKLVLYDEFQDQSPSQADMLVKRIGKDGKIVITGDIAQIHAPYRDEFNNGIVYVTGLLYDFPMVARVSLLKEEVERHELVRLIAERQAGKKKTP